MIQRKQSLFLLAVAVIGILMLFIPFQQFSTSEKISPICLMPGCSPEILGNAIYGPMVLNFLVIIISILVIFQYKSRVLQYKLSNILALLNVFVTGLFFLLTFTKVELSGSVSYSFGAFLPIIGAVFAFLAAHFIKKDEQLVRSADRIR